MNEVGNGVGTGTGTVSGNGNGEAAPPASPAAFPTPTAPPFRTPSERTALRELEYAVVDLETTGGHGYGHHVTEVCAVVVNGAGQVIDEYATLVNPRRRIPAFVSRLTRITDDMVRKAPVFERILPRLHEILAGRVFVAHNAGFDWHFLLAEIEWSRRTRLPELPPIPARAPGEDAYVAVSKALRAAGYHLSPRSNGGNGALIVREPGVAGRYGDTNARPGNGPGPGPESFQAPTDRVLCTVKLAKRLVPEVSRRSLDELQNFFGIENEARHRAWGDARATATILARLFERLEEREIATWEALQELLKRRRRKRRKRRARPMPMEDA